jgi:tripartite-type tricarboxylate transporter receptor subunit TctC
MGCSFFPVKTPRKAVCIVATLFFGGFLAMGIPGNVSWAAEEFPSREVKLVVPYAAGGAIDSAIRILANKTEKILGGPIVIINNTAGGGAAGALTVAQAKPDGYTLLVGTSGVLILKPLLTPEVRFRPTDFTPICRTVVTPLALLVTNEAPWKTLKELVEYAKGNPGKLRVTVGQAGTLVDVFINLFKGEAGIDMTNVPTTAGTAQTAALLGGHSELCMASVAQSASFIKAGRLRVLACTHQFP